MVDRRTALGRDGEPHRLKVWYLETGTDACAMLEFVDGSRVSGL